jgi:arginine exporter protein ArgO
MNRQTAMIVTGITALFCGCPGLILMGLGLLAAVGTQMPSVMAQNASTPEEVLLGAAMFLCFGLILLIIPVAVGFFTLRTKKPADVIDVMPNEPLPPAS